MLGKPVKRSIAYMVIVVNMLVVFGDGYAAEPEITLVINPKNTEVYTGSGKIVITADAPGKDLTFTWKLEGLGKLEGEGAAVLYTPPKKIDKDSVQAAVTVVVKDKAGEEATKSIIFTIFPGPAPTPTPALGATLPEQEGSGKGKTVALSLGAAAALGGGVALLVGGDSNGDGATCTKVGGYCWYLGGQGQSCTQVCASHGGYNEATRTYAGSEGSSTTCETVLNALGYACSGYTLYQSGDYPGMGCFHARYQQEICLRSESSPTTADASSDDAYRACACNR